MKLVTAAQMQALDHRTIHEAGVPGSVLMERAGQGVVSAIEKEFGLQRGRSVTVVCGKGNNGGDGFVVARLLRKRGAKARALLLAPTKSLTKDSAVMHRRFVKVAGRASCFSCDSEEQIRAVLADSDLIIDALLGTGLSSEVTGAYRAVIHLMNGSGKPIVAVDIPSGLDADHGSVLGAAVQASMTVTFGLPKLGLYTGAGIDHAGAVTIADIGIPQAYVESVVSRQILLTADQARRAFQTRILSSHKGTFGHVGILAGSVGKTGAAALAALAALRVGAGLVTVATPSRVNDVLEAKLLEAMTFPLPCTEAGTLSQSGFDAALSFMRSRTAMAIGPGLSTHPETVELVLALLPHLDRPSVLDADALNAIASRPTLLSSCKVPPIITPHPGEMARLERAVGTSSMPADRIERARRFAGEHRCLVLLKGARTVIARPDGLVAVNPTGNPGMATAGTGDVLTGMVAGLLAQSIPSWEAACAAVYCHGLAGDLASHELGQPSVLARDVISHIADAFQNVTQ